MQAVSYSVPKQAYARATLANRPFVVNLTIVKFDRNLQKFRLNLARI